MDETACIQEKAVVEPGVSIGARSRIGAFAHLQTGAQVGEDCDIGELAHIAGEVVAGRRVIIGYGAYLGMGVVLEDGVVIGPHVTFAPGLAREKTGGLCRPTLVRQGAQIGSSATILPGIVVGQNAVVGAGAVVTKDVPPNAVVTGNPAYIEGYIVSSKLRPEVAPEIILKSGETAKSLGVGGARAYEIPLIEDLRGKLTFGEIGRHLPFPPQRYFVVFEVPNQKLRGEHAHKQLHQFLICLRGSFTLLLDDSENRAQIMLDSPRVGVHIPPLIWAAQFNFTQDAVMLVLASDKYDAEDYLRDYDQFLAFVKGRKL